jgi:hypothetical protein
MSAKLGAAAVALAWTPNAVFGGVSNLSQERTVTAYVNFGNAEDPPPPDATIRSDKTGRFDRSAESHVRNDLGDHSDAITSQTSTIGNNFVSAHGAFDAFSQGELLAYSNTIDASFRVTAKTNYHLSFGPVVDEQLGFAPDDFISLELRKSGSPSPIVSKTYGGSDFDLDVVKVATSGPLAPGDYELRFALQDELAQRFEVGHYDLQFSIDNGTRAVPLPPAAWTGLLTLAGLAGAMGYAARRSQVT